MLSTLTANNYLLRRKLTRRCRPTKSAWSLAVLVALMFSKFVYLASISNYYIFISCISFTFQCEARRFICSSFSRLLLREPLLAARSVTALDANTSSGGPFLACFRSRWSLPYVNLFWTSLLSIIIGIVLASAFSAILVYAQELLPGRIGMVSGLFFGLAFGVAGVAAALLGKLADARGIDFVYHLCAFLPAIGILTAFLPNLSQNRTVFVNISAD